MQRVYSRADLPVRIGVANDDIAQMGLSVGARVSRLVMQSLQELVTQESVH